VSIVFALCADAHPSYWRDPMAGHLIFLDQIDRCPPRRLIHAARAGHDLNDPIELAAIESTRRPGPDSKVYSHKGALGIASARPGLVAVVLNCMSHQSGIVPGHVFQTARVNRKRIHLDQNIVQRLFA